jgi:hypothetical protein
MLFSRKLFTVEALLGTGLGLGYLTSLRFFGFVGVSEILIFISIVLLFMRHWKVFFFYNRSVEGYIKGYILFVLFFQLPVVTLVTFIFTDYNSTPWHVISFIMGGALAFLLIHALRSHEFDFAQLTHYFFYTFVVTNLITFVLFPSSLDSVRYEGGANNPNQLLFYASSLSLLLLMYKKRLAIIGFPIITFIMFKTGSDAYLLTIFVTIFSYFIFLFFFSIRIKFLLKFLFFFATFFIFIFYLINTYSNDILEIWLVADEGNARMSLMLNGLDVVRMSPLVGWGSGSFSGLTTSFEGYEAHSTFIDLAMQLGIIFPVLIYGLMVVATFRKVRDREYLVAAFIAAFIVSGLFHYVARHFTFWVEFSIFYSYVFYDYKAKKSFKGRIRCVE